MKDKKRILFFGAGVIGSICSLEYGLQRLMKDINSSEQTARWVKTTYFEINSRFFIMISTAQMAPSVMPGMRSIWPMVAGAMRDSLA